MSDRTALVTALILDRPLCIRCLAAKSGGTLAELDAVIDNVEKALILHRLVDRCRACGNTEITFSVDRPLIGSPPTAT
jgi:hypothetical protein